MTAVIAWGGGKAPADASKYCCADWLQRLQLIAAAEWLLGCMARHFHSQVGLGSVTCTQIYLAEHNTLQPVAVRLLTLLETPSTSCAVWTLTTVDGNIAQVESMLLILCK